MFDLVLENVIFADPAEDRATFAEPAKAPVGMELVLVNGHVVVQKGRLTGARPGRVLRPSQI